MPKYNVIFEHKQIQYWVIEMDAETPEQARQEAWNDYMYGRIGQMTPGEEFSPDYADFDEFEILEAKEVDKSLKE